MRTLMGLNREFIRDPARRPDLLSSAFRETIDNRHSVRKTTD